MNVRPGMLQTGLSAAISRISCSVFFCSKRSRSSIMTFSPSPEGSLLLSAGQHVGIPTKSPRQLAPNSGIHPSFHFLSFGSYGCIFLPVSLYGWPVSIFYTIDCIVLLCVDLKELQHMFMHQFHHFFLTGRFSVA